MAEEVDFMELLEKGQLGRIPNSFVGYVGRIIPTTEGAVILIPLTSQLSEEAGKEFTGRR